ncbi:unnamed protein product [Protopolystoma xenopodis]|uniref:Uncharacterized protein n=1 Tax=Protopolystoma xenopodis TaxID=117903 RepID=A0A3S5ARH0_9PLAT|nr:unnamed protein product [Protopolystoma xenopodis]
MFALTDEISVRIHRGLGAVRRGPICTNLQSQFRGDTLTASGEVNLQIPSTRLFNRNDRYSNIDYSLSSTERRFETNGKSRISASLINIVDYNGNIQFYI